MFFLRDLRVSARVVVCDRVSSVLSSGRAPQSLLLLPRRLARASSHECARSNGSDMWIYQTRVCRGLCGLCGVSRGSHEHSCGVWGAEVYNLRLFISAKGRGVLSSLSYVRRFGVFHPRVRRPHPARTSPLFLPRDVSPPASWLISIKGDQVHQPSSQLGRVLSWVSKDYVEGALPHGRAREIVEPLAAVLITAFGSRNTPSPRIAFANRSVHDDPAQGSNQP